MEQDDLGKTIRIGSRLKEEQKWELVQCLRAHVDVFAWTHEDMPGIDPEVACHRLAIRKGARAVRQKRRSFNQERYEAINGKVEKLLKAGFIREVNYLEWISNVVLVKKVLESNLCTSFALFISLNIDVLHLIIVIYLCFIFIGAILLIGAKIELQDDV